MRGTRALAIRALYAGEAGDAERLLRPLRATAGTALLDGFQSMSYAQTAMGGTPPRHLDLFNELPDAVIDVLVKAGEQADSPVSTVEIRHWAGAMARPGPNAGPVGHRKAPFSVITDASVPDLAEAPRPYVDRRILPELPGRPHEDRGGLHDGQLPAPRRGEAGLRPG